MLYWIQMYCSRTTSSSPVEGHACAFLASVVAILRSLYSHLPHFPTYQSFDVPAVLDLLGVLVLDDDDKSRRYSEGLWTAE